MACTALRCAVALMPFRALGPADLAQEDDKKKRTALKEARIAFLEEEVPALVAKGVSLAEVKAKSKAVNSKLGSKFEISETELEGTYEACSKLLREGADISGVAGSSNAAERILAEEVGVPCWALGARQAAEQSQSTSIQ